VTQDKVQTTKTTADQVEEFGALQFTDNEIATIMQMSMADLRKDYRPNVDRGRLLAEAEVRKSLLDLAKHGSTPAQKEFMKLNAKAKRSAQR
jgi:hypothetical protein